MKVTLLLFSFILSIPCFGQSSDRLWEEGELTWDDFKGEPFRLSPNSSELNYQMSYFPTKKRINNTTYLIYQTKNYINPNTSWVKESDKSFRLLRYNQVIFNILELHRRRLQAELQQVSQAFEAAEKFRTIYQNSTYEIRQFQDGTEMGTDASAIKLWDQMIDEKLKDYPIEWIPEVSERNFGIGLNAGFGTGVLTGAFSDFFRPSFNFIFGFDLAYKNTTLFLNGTVARSKVKRDFTEDGLLWPDDLSTNVAVIDVSIGQTLIDGPKHKLTPFAGLGILEFSAAKNEGEQFEDFRIYNYGLIFGLNYDFKFRKRVRLTPSRYGTPFQERYEHNIRFKLYATSADFENIGGSSINLTIGYSLFGRIIGVD